MNVAHFISPYLPQTETFVYNYIRSMRGVRSYIYTYECENLDQFELDNLNKVSGYSLPWILYHASQRIFRNGKIANKYLFDRNNVRSIRSSLRGHGVRLIHSHFGHMGCYNVNLKQRMKLPMVTTFYGWDMSFLPLVGWGVRYVPLFSVGDCFVVEGSQMKRRLAELGCPEEKIRIIHIGADLNRFEYRERRIEDRDKVIMLFCGRLIEKKGLEYALKALALIKDQRKDVELRVIGDGPLKDHVMGLVRALKLGDVVKLLGYLSYAETKKEMDNAHILVQPSVTAENGETEGGAPTVLIEAQASGMPILASSHADIPEVVLDGRSGLLSEERDVDTLGKTWPFYLIIRRNGRAWVWKEESM